MLHAVRRRMATTCKQQAIANAILTARDKPRTVLKEAVNMLHIPANADSTVYAYLLQSCIRNRALAEGKQIHALILNQKETKFMEDIFLQNSLLAMYAKCGSVVDARSVFDRMVDRDVFSWNVIIAAYKQQGISEEALTLFHEMQHNGVQPNEFTFSSVVPACTSSESLAEGVDIHRQIIKNGFQSQIFVVNALIDMYAKFGNMHKACVLFDKMREPNIVSWTAMITGYAHNGLSEEALKAFEQMQQNGVQPNEFTFANVVSTCTNSASLAEGVDIHRKIIRSGHHSHIFVVNALIDMYAKFGNMHKACVLFDKMYQPNVISWTAMIVGFAQNGHVFEALKFFQNMQLTDLIPDSVILASILSVCATFLASECGKEIHGKVIRSGFLSHVIVVNALIDMYAKCGNVQEARTLFDNMHYRDCNDWTAMIAGYAMHGFGKEAIELFDQMENLGINPDYVTLISVLSACSHAGLVDEGYQYFNSMTEDYHITPTMEHYVCMVDLLGRAGRLNEAKDFVKNMPIKPDASVWTCFLGACRMHNNLEMAEFIAEHLLELDQKSALPFVLLSNIYAMAGRWNEIENVRTMMKNRGIQKQPGCSWIEVNKQVHTFIVGDRSHQKTQEMHV